MNTDNILREWAIHNLEIHRAKYTGEIVKFGKNAKGKFQNFRPKKPIRILSVNSMIGYLHISEIPKLKNEIEDDEIERAKADSDPILALKIERNKALVAMLEGFCKGKTEEAAIKALDEYLTSKESYETFNEVPEQRKTHSQKDNYFKDNNFHELVMRTMEKVGTHWNKVKLNLKNNTLKGETINYRSVSNFEGEMRPQIQYFHEGYPEPFEVMESTFKKYLSSYRKQKKLPLPSNKK